MALAQDQKSMLADFLNTETAVLQRRIHYMDRDKESSRKRKRSLVDRFDGEYLGQSELAEGEVKGDVVLRELNRALNCFTTRSQHQALFQEVFKQACLPVIYGDDFRANELRIKQEHLIEDLKQFTLVRCPRRMGKTWSVAQFVAAALLCIPDAEIAIFSPSRRQSSMLLNKIKNFLGDLRDDHGFNFTVDVKNNEEQLWILRDGTRRIVVALPASERSVRGIGGNIMICEEAALMTVDFFLSVVAPILRMDRTAMIAISTPQGDENYYDKYSELTMEGKPFFNTFIIYSACSDCRKKGIEEQCPHMRHMLPPWISASKEDSIALLYKSANRDDLHRQENLGISLKGSKDAFPRQYVNRLFNKEATPLVTPEQLVHKPRTVFVAIDPNAGGQGSDTAMCSAFMDRGTFVICGLESISTGKLDDWETCLGQIEAHFHALLRQPTFRFSQFVLFIEGDLGTHAQLIKKHLYTEKRVPRLSIISKKDWDTSQVEHGGNQVGMRSTHAVKDKMCQTMKRFLANSQIAFFSKCVTLHAPPTVNDPVDEAKRILRQQLHNYKKVTEIPKNRDFGRIRVSFSGKGTGHVKDDLCIAAQLCVFWSQHFLQRRVQ